MLGGSLTANPSCPGRNARHLKSDTTAAGALPVQTRTPRASKDAETPKEAETVTPKPRGRPPKTPKVEAPAEQPEPTPRRRGRPPKKAAQ